MVYSENRDKEFELATKAAQSLPMESVLVAINLQLGKTRL